MLKFVLVFFGTVAGLAFVAALITPHDSAPSIASTPVAVVASTPEPTPTPIDTSKLTGKESLSQIMDKTGCNMEQAKEIYFKQEEKIYGPAPKAGRWGVSLEIHDAVKSVLSDPDSYKYIKAGGPWGDEYEGQKCWLVKVLFRSKNRFGGYEQGLADAYVIGGTRRRY